MNEDSGMAFPLEKANLKNCLLKRGDQIQRWHISDTNKTSHAPRNAVRVKFRDGIMFLAACSSGDVDEVIRLIKGGADINSANIDGITALHQVWSFKIVL
jgi:protein phosphatase 1 regulatory subunit 12A